MTPYPQANLLRSILWSTLYLSLFFMACDDEGGKTEEPVVRLGGEEAGEAAGTEAGTTAGSEAGTEAGSEAGTEAGSEAGTEAGTMAGTDNPLVRTIDTCEELCGVYEMCDAPDAHPWGACLEGCMGEDWEEQRFRSYVSCLKLEPCETISACLIPPAPLPSCEEACAQLDLCETDYRFPTALTQTGNCITACADETWAGQISNCVQSNERRLCDDPTFFDSCILESRGGSCYPLCQAQADCDETLDVVDCTVACLTEAPEDDALAAYRQEQSRNCVVNANSCEEIDACLTPAVEPVNESAELVCGAAETCGVFAEGTCPELANRALRELSPEGINCLVQTLEADCSAELTSCFSNTAPPATDACADYCFIGALCDSLPEEQSEFDCVEECEALAADGDPAAFAPYQAQVACLNVGSCQDFSNCISGSGNSDACADLCAQQALCGVEEEAECLMRCSSRYATERSRRERTCGSLLSCESSELCQIPEAPNCEDYCQPLQSCGLADPSCITLCDNAELAQPEAHLPLLTCVNTSERCDYIGACETDQSAAQACLNYCSYLSGCNGAEGTPGEISEECALACARGELSDEQGAEFIPAYDCLSALEAGSMTCEDLSTCVNSAPSMCNTLCEAATTCALPLVGELADDCVTACEGGAVSETIQLCAISATQRASGCGEVATCLGFPVPEPTPACEQYCSALKSCDPSIDLYTCHSLCITDSTGDALRATCTEIVDSCDNISRCQDEEAESPVECLRACQDLDMNCSVTGEGQRFNNLTACADECGGVVLALGEDSATPVNECIANAMCDADRLDACFSGDLAPASREICERSWNVLQLCNINDVLVMFGSPPLEETQFYIDCDAQYTADPAATIAQVECVEMSYVQDPSCLSAAFNCGFF